MDQQTANKLFKEYGCILLLNFPAQFDFNIDNQVWVTNDKFMGLKLVPPGGHYVHFSEKKSQIGEKFGFFHYFNKSEVVVKTWNNQHECFEGLPEGEELAYIEGVRNYAFDQNLGAYSQVEYSQWKCLSNYLTKEVISRLEPIAKSGNMKKRIRDQEEQKDEKKDNQKDADKDSEDEEKIVTEKSDLKFETMMKNNSKMDKIEGDFDENIIKSLEKELKKEDERMEKAMKYMYEYKEAYGNVYYTDIPIRKLLHGFTKEQITRSNFDKSVILNELEQKYKKEYNNSEEGFYKSFLGELQFAFILFYLGQNYEGFEQWKKIICLVCHCDEAISTNKEFFTDLIPVIYEQLDQLPNDFFDFQNQGGAYLEPNSRKKGSELKNNFIIESLNSFYEICISEPIEGRKVSKKIKSRVKKLRALMSEKFDINVTTEDERLTHLLSKSKDLCALSQIQEADGTLVEREQQVSRRLADNNEEEQMSDNIEMDNDNTYDNEENQALNRVTSKDIEILRRQFEEEDDEYLPSIVDLNEKLISFN
ncbi:unnamed protein product [Moneuplotes crassus]|uniref:AAR2 protein n=1 Tax=Euplotes crassus TaxID=5936 RepID=A0AAD1UBB6_EUPCR|nr:unnamed protein product [Moneuplotes crassus]